VTGFVDDEVNRLLDLDTDREAALTLVPVGFFHGDLPKTVPIVEPLHLATAPLSKMTIDYPAIRDMHAASSLTTEHEVKIWREELPKKNDRQPTGQLFSLAPFADVTPTAAPLEHVIRHRGSTRNFARESITLPQLSNILLGATQGIPTDFLSPPDASLTDLYLIINAVEGVPPGAYVFHQSRQTLELLREGSFRKEAGYLGLGQQLPGDASVNIFCLTDLGSVLGRLGNRGYRAAQLEAAVIGGKCYLAAYAQGLGATGLTFFDDDVTEFFSPHAAGKSVMFLTAIGKPAKKKTSVRL
jgi:nitroreductase